MNDIPLSRKKFQKIIRFYLFECPVSTFNRRKKKDIVLDFNQNSSKYDYAFKRVSKRGVTFHDRGIYGSKLNSFRVAMQKVAPVALISVTSETEVIKPEDQGEFIVIKKNENNVSTTEGYFYCIRNAFAHGDFDVVGKMYYFHNTSNGKLKGIAELREETLLKWIDLAEMPIEEIKKINKNRTKKK